jgi:hypothetical protein
MSEATWMARWQGKVQHHCRVEAAGPKLLAGSGRRDRQQGQAGGAKKGMRANAATRIPAANARPGVRNARKAEAGASAGAAAGVLARGGSTRASTSVRGTKCWLAVENVSRPTMTVYSATGDFAVTAVSVLAVGPNSASGAFPGHTGTCVWPDDGCQPGLWASKLAHANTKQTAKSKGLITIP